MTSMTELDRRMKKTENAVRKINNLLGIMPPLVKPVDWIGLTERDKKVLEFLINQDQSKRFTTTQIAEGIELPNPSTLGRVHVYNSLKKVQRIARRKRKRIVDFDRRHKTWQLNRFDFTFQLDI